MRDRLATTLLMAGLLAISGCGKSGTGSDAAAANGTSASTGSGTAAANGKGAAGPGDALKVIGADSTGGDFDEEMQADYPEQGPAPAEAISVEDFNASWQTDLNIENQPAGDVLAKLAGEIGLTFEESEEANDSLNANVRVLLEKGTRLRAIEEVCRQIGMTPAYFPRALKLKPTPRHYPVAFAGPFLIQVRELEERPPYATGRLTVRVYGAGLPATAGAAIDRANVNGSGGVTLTAVVDSEGNGLVDGGPSHGATARSAGNILDTTADVALKNLVKRVEKLSVRGKVQFRLPTKVIVAKFDKLKAEATAEAGDIRFIIKEIDLGQESSVSVTFRGVDSSKVQLVGYDADNKTINGYGNASSGFNMESSIDSQFMGQLASLEIRVTEESSAVSYEFAIQDIPLRMFAEMPQQIEPLKFEGVAPVTFEFVKFDGDDDQQKVIVKVTNHTNKPLEGLEMKLAYLDANAKTIVDMPYSHYEGTEPVVDAGKTTELELSSFMPERTKSVKVTIQGLRCFDATSWKHDGEVFPATP